MEMSHFLHFHKDDALTDTGRHAFGEPSGKFAGESAQVFRVRRGLGRPVKSFQLAQSLFKGSSSMGVTNLTIADEMGMSAEEIIGTLVAIAPIVGSARVISAATASM